MIGLFNLFVAAWLLSTHRSGDGVSVVLIVANLFMGTFLILQAMAA